MLHNVFHRFIYHLTWPLRALLYTPSRVLAGSRRLAGISLPAKMAWLTFFLLVVCVVVSLIAFRLSSESGPFWAKVTFGFIFWVTLLVILIPFVLYKTLKYWLEGDVSPYPDIHDAWRAGLAELEKKEISLARTPLFLILGSAGESQEQSLFDAARLKLDFRGVPRGDAPLHWYASQEAIYLACTGVGSLSHLVGSPREAHPEYHRPGGPSPRGPKLDQTMVGTLSQGEPEAESEQASEEPAPARSPYDGVTNIYETLALPPEGATLLPSGEPQTPKRVVADPETEHRMRYLMHLVRKARHPLAPINGVLTLLPFGLMDGLTERGDHEAQDVQLAVRNDLDAVKQYLKVRCPVIAFVVGMEEEPGFGELVRRVGADRAVGQRFGKGFHPETPPLAEHLAALCAHACGAFEDWVYLLFREKDALSKPGNTKLYSLLCKVRRVVKRRLEEVLVYGYRVKGEYDSPEKGLLFSGCYFGAIGQTEDRQAFAHSVLKKLQDHERESMLGWSDEAVQHDEQCQRMAHLGLAVDLGLIVLLIGLIIYYWGWVSGR